MENINEKIQRYKGLERDIEQISFALLVNENLIFGPRKLKKANDLLLEELEKVGSEMKGLYPDIKDHYIPAFNPEQE